MADELVLQVKRGSTSSWDAEDNNLNGFRLKPGQIGYDKTKNLIRIGNGTSIFANLPAIQSFDGGTVNNQITINNAIDPNSDKGLSMRYLNKNNENKAFVLGASNKNQYFYLSSTDKEVGNIILIYYDGTIKRFKGKSDDSALLQGHPVSDFLMTSGGTITGSIINYSHFNQGSWNSPKNGIITQVFSTSSAQHSIFVGRDSSNNVYYSIDCYDGTSPRMRLYAGSEYFEVGNGGIKYNGNELATQNYVANNYLNKTGGTITGGVFVNKSTGEGDLGVTYNQGAGSLYLHASASQNSRGIYDSKAGSIIYIDTNNKILFYGEPANTIPVSKGGTGGTTVATARTRLSVPGLDHYGSNYYRIKRPDGENMEYLMTPPSGIIPYQSGGSGYIGTNSYKFNYMYAVKGYFDNIIGGGGTTSCSMMIYPYIINYGTFTVPTYTASSSSGYGYYGNVNVSVSFSRAFSYVSGIVMTSLDATTGVIAIEPAGYSNSAITSVRIHRSSSATNVSGFKVSYVAIGYNNS